MQATFLLPFKKSCRSGPVLSLWLHGLYSSFTVDLWDSSFCRGSSAMVGRGSELESLFFSLLLHFFPRFLLLPGLKLSVGWGHITFLYPEHPAASYARGLLSVGEEPPPFACFHSDFISLIWLFFLLIWKRQQRSNPYQLFSTSSTRH